MVGAYWEDGNATGVNGDGSNDSAPNSGAAYVFVRNDTNWTQQAYLKASNTESNDYFGHTLALEGDTVVIGAYQESSGANGVNGNQADNSVTNAGAAYVFVRRGTQWNQEAYLKGSNPGIGDLFGRRGLSLSGGTAVIAAPSEDSGARGINGNQSDNSAPNSGAAYVFSAVGVGPPISITPTGTGGYLLRLTGLPGLTYRLERTSSLTEAWGLRSTLAAPASGLIQFYDLAPPPGQAFYRIAQP